MINNKAIKQNMIYVILERSDRIYQGDPIVSADSADPPG
jgi:hypothetical protein